MKKNLLLLSALLLVPTLTSAPKPAPERAPMTNEQIQQEIAYQNSDISDLYAQVNQLKEHNKIIHATMTNLLETVTKQQRSGFSKFCYWTVQTIIGVGIIVLVIIALISIQQ